MQPNLKPLPLSLSTFEFYRNPLQNERKTCMNLASLNGEGQVRPAAFYAPG